MRTVAKTLAASLLAVVALFCLAGLVAPRFGSAASAACGFGLASVGLVVLAFVCEYVDSSLGMGYGTALTPVLLAVSSLEPLAIVPCVLLSELLTGISAGVAHHLAGNVSFTRRSRATKVVVLLSTCSVVGAGAAVAVALNIPKSWLKLFIGLIVLSMGVFMLVARGGFRFSWTRLTGLGLLAAFNKGMSGGGYGPLVTGGQVLAGVEEKSAIGITSLSEGVTCIVGLAAYLVAGRAIMWSLAIPLTIGALASVPVSALTVNRVSPRALRPLIGVATVSLGLLTLARLL